MTAVRTAPGPVGGRSRTHGGLPARVAVVRWSWRLLRREWRRQALLLALLVTTVAGAVCGLVAVDAYQYSPVGTFGSARQLVRLDAGDDGRRTLEARIASARSKLGTVEVIAHRQVPVPGSVSVLDVRAQDPHGPYGAGRLRLLEGRYPASAGEVALTRSAAALFRTGVGRSSRFGGRSLTVVGLVENPGRLADTFALAAPPGAADPEVAGLPAASVDLLADASPDAMAAFRAGGDGPLDVQDRYGDASAGADVLVLAAATVALLLVALVAAAGFAVIAHRRLRQIGMLGAIGATDRHLRLVLVGQGLFTGLAGAATGTALGLAAWLSLAPRLEGAAGHRIDAFALPWTLLAPLLAVAVLTPAAAAWWPARTMARVPVVRALSARPPEPVRGRRSVRAAVVLVAAGAGCLVASRRTDGLLVVAGLVAVVAGMLLVSPLVVRGLAAAAGRAPLTVRLVLRDLGRHQARSGAALAAITLAIGLPVAISVVAAVSRDGAAAGNLSARDVLVRAPYDGPLVPVLSAPDLRHRQEAVQRYAAQLGGTATPLVMAYDPAVPPGGMRSGGSGRQVLEAGRPTGPRTWASLRLYVATPDAVRRFGLRPPGRAGADVLTFLPGHDALTLLGQARRGGDRAATAHVPGPAYSSQPRVFITPDAVRRGGWRTLTAGWFVSAPHDLSAAQRSAARDMAVANGLTTETRNLQEGLETVRRGCVAAGAGLALGVLAMTVGTVRAESADDLRTLTAAGAGPRTRRGLGAATAGSLALAGTLLGTAGAYLVLLCAYADDPASLRHGLYLPLLTAVPGVPLLAAAAGWLAAGREPTGTARRLLE
ncbi:FtsX-like permease family protein [Streptomyces sp. HPF1205]|uniref:FtsX-like permease family protein n=1 Tax=Streptomyces sp. HPF1205 TaxID=2873262 RepID=UPI001CED5796|nr:FtsX-like permease family protein [Streptomyces sp. HPF1205]